MTEDEYISRLRTCEDGEEVSSERLLLVEEAIREFPQSVRLWVLRGNLIELGPDDDQYSLNDALASYQNAIEIDPLFAEAWEEVGHFYDAILDDEVAARKYFSEAERLRASDG